MQNCHFIGLSCEDYVLVLQNDLKVADYYAAKANENLQKGMRDIKLSEFYMQKAEHTREWMNHAELRENESKKSK